MFRVDCYPYPDWEVPLPTLATCFLWGGVHGTVVGGTLEYGERVSQRTIFLKSSLPPRCTRVLDASGYARIKHWRLYAEEGLARCEVALWLGDESLAVEYAGRTLSSYDVSHSQGAKLEDVTAPRLFATGYGTPQPRLFALDALGEGGWLKALRLCRYAARSRNGPETLQEVLFSYLDAV